MKRGKVLYRASYSNTINTRTLAIFDGTFQYNGQEVSRTITRAVPRAHSKTSSDAPFTNIVRLQTATTNNLGVTTIYDLEGSSAFDVYIYISSPSLSP